MVGSAVGAGQCFYWLNEDVKAVEQAVSRKIEGIKGDVVKKDEQAALQLAALQDAAASTSTTTTGVAPST